MGTVHTEFSLIAADGVEIIGSKWMPDTEVRTMVLAVHGHGEHIGRFKSMAEYLNCNSIGFMGIDLRGHGKSGGKRGHTPSYELLLDDVGLLIGKAINKHPGISLCLYGHSMGGNIATNYILKRDCSPLTGAILSSPWYRLAFEPPAFKVALGKLMNGIFPSFTQSSELDTSALCSDVQEVKAYEEDPLVHDRISAGLFFTTYRAGLWAMENAGKLRLPSLLMHGDQDALTSSAASMEFAERAGSNLKFKLWEGYMHEPHNEPEKTMVFEYMVQWINSLTHSK